MFWQRTSPWRRQSYLRAGRHLDRVLKGLRTPSDSDAVTEADWHHWRPADLRPYVQTALEAFGPDRCMFGSDWPVCLLAADYARVMDSLQQIVGLDEWIFGNSARRVYGLADAEP